MDRSEGKPRWRSIRRESPAKKDFNVAGKKIDNGALLVQRLLLFRTEGK